MRRTMILALACVSAMAWAADPQEAGPGGGSSGAAPAAAPAKPEETTKAPAPSPGADTARDAAAWIRDWPDASRTAAQKILDRYGEPDAMTGQFLAWDDTGPWKRTVVYREGTPHAFPRPHLDVLEQSVEVQVPTDLLDELSRYDGSLTYERTTGELASTCEDEAMNFLAMNLAYEVISGKRTVEDARRVHAETADAWASGATVDGRVKELLFPTREDAGDPDRPFPGT